MRERVLVVDDDHELCDLLRCELEQRGLDVAARSSACTAWEELERTPVDVVLTDLRMPGSDGIDLCVTVTRRLPEVPVVVMTAFGSTETAVAAMRAGAYDFISKPVEPEALAIVIRRALHHRALQQRVRSLSEELGCAGRFEALVGESPAMQRVFALLERLAQSDASVLILGETGTGKELAARALHTQGLGRETPFVAVNCAALPETLLESELFGHERGAFTGAVKPHCGLLAQANGGTLFLDEIGEMALTTQAKLLRALEERRFRPVGSTRELEVDFRLVAATNRDLGNEVDGGGFRPDLFFRVGAVELELPPLRERGNDVLLIAQQYIEGLSRRSGKHVTGLSRAAAETLLSYPWPGNVRELRNCIERAAALAPGPELGVDDLPERVRTHSLPSLLGGTDSAGLATLAEVERRHILHVLEATGGNRTRCARVLGLDRKTLYRKLAQYGKGRPGSQAG